MNSNIAELISRYSIVSFDIYDTLLLRLFAKPTDLFGFIEMNENANGFLNTRLKAEKQARKVIKNIKDDVTLDEIYKNMPEEFQSLKEVELNYEKKFTIRHYKNYQIYQEAIRQNKKVIFVSDIYLPEKFMKTLLETNGYKDYQKLFLSGEIGKTKLRGTLYDYVLGVLDVNPNEIIHFGDSLNNDIKQANKHGVFAYRTIPYLEEFLSKKENYKFKKFYKKTKGNIYSGILISQFALFDLESKKFENFNQKLGYYIAGLAAYAYINYIITISYEYDLLLFIARDGYLLEKVYKEMCKFCNITPVNSKYVYAQRILKISSIFDKDNLYLLLKTYFQINNIDFNKWSLFFNVNKFYKKYKNKIEIWINKNKEEYAQYYNNLDISTNKILTIDMMTANFTSKKFIASMLNNKIVNGVFFSSSKQNVDKMTKIYIDGKLFFKNEYLYYLVEPLFTSPEKPLLTIKNNKPIYNEKINDKEHRYLIKKVADTEIGMFCFINNMLKYFGNITIPNDIVYEFFMQYVRYSGQDDIVGYKNIPLSDGNILNIFNTNLYSKLRHCIKKDL